MGTVWLCADEVLGREVAVKQVGLLPGESAPDLARALREARSSAGLHHPHVVAVFDAVEGTSLGDDGVVTVQLVYDVAEQESRRLLVERGGEGWVISDDLGPA
jgi:serine/threonine protein kinase